LIGNDLYQKIVDGQLLKCLGKHGCTLIMAEAHKGICGAHQTGVKMKWLLRRHGYF